MAVVTPPTLLVLAAGLGNRYGGLKQMDPVGPAGEALLDYSVYDAIRAGFGKVVFVIREDMEAAFEEGVASRFREAIPVELVLQRSEDLPCAAPEGSAARTKPWGTGHAVWAARNHIEGDFAVINADDFYGRLAYKALATFFASTVGETNVYAMVSFALSMTLSENGTVARGLCSVNAEGMLESVEELTNIRVEGTGAVNRNDDGSERRLSGDEPVSMNCWGLRHSIFEHLGDGLAAFLDNLDGERLQSVEYYLPGAVDALISSGSVEVEMLAAGAQWFGVTYSSDRELVVEQLTALVEGGRYPDPLWG